MKKEADKIAMIAKLLSKKPVLKKLNKNAATMQHQLSTLWDAQQSNWSHKILTIVGRIGHAHKITFKSSTYGIKGLQAQEVESD